MPRARQRGEELDLLLPLKGEPKKRTFATVDIEARNWVDAYAVDFYDGEKHVTFESPRYADGRLMGASIRNRAGELRRGIDRTHKARVRTAYDCRLNFLRWLVETGDTYTGYWIYAHNGGNYDFLFFFRKLIKEMARLGYETDVLPVGSCALRLTIIDPMRDEYNNPIREQSVDENGQPKLDEAGKPIFLTKARRKWTLLDSARLIPMALDKIGEAFEIGRKVVLGPELGVPVETSTKVLYRMLSMPKFAHVMRKYLHADTELLYRVLVRFQEFVNKLGGQVGITLASTSLDVWRRGGYMGSYKVHRNWHLSDCPDLERKPEEASCEGCGIEWNRGVLRGGRTEPWTMSFERKKEEDGYLNYVDVNSHYSHCMLEPMPTGPGIAFDGGTEESVWKNHRTRIGFVDCEVYVPEDTYLPPMPFRLGGKLCFPTGRFRARWDTCELEALREVGGRIEKVHRSVWYEADPVFAEFVTRLFAYADRNSKQWMGEGMKLTSKNIRNSAFGKTGIREERERIWVSPSGRVPNFTEFFDMDSDTFIRKEIYRAPYLAPAIAAHITSLARVRLWRYAMRVLKAGGRIFYCDTDSLIFWMPFRGLVQVHAREVLPLSGRLGDLKLEHDRIRSFSTTLPKLYTFDCESPREGNEREPNDGDCRCYREWWEKDRKVGIPWCSYEIRAKGVGGGLDADDITAEEYAKFTDLSLPESQRTIIRYRMAKLKESRKEFLRKKRDFPFVLKQTKVIRGSYDKRIVQPDGIETRPFTLNGAIEMMDDNASELALPF